jgi:hypothetical protein
MTKLSETSIGVPARFVTLMVRPVDVGLTQLQTFTFPEEVVAFAITV